MRRLLVVAVGILSLLIMGGSTASASVSPIQHVVLIMEENHSIGSITSGSMPFLTGLGSTYAKATHLKAVTHPSLPNYMALTSGLPTFSGSDCSPSSCRSNANNIFHQTSWRVWAESEPKPCAHSGADPYAARHTAAPYYTDLDATCPKYDTAFSPSNPPSISAAFTLIVPNLNHDAHDGSLGAADSWLKTVVNKLMAQSAYQNGSTLIEVTFDEGSGDQTVYTAFIHPSLHHVVLTTPATHYSTLRLNESLLGLSLLGNAKSANPLALPIS